MKKLLSLLLLAFTLGLFLPAAEAVTSDSAVSMHAQVCKKKKHRKKHRKHKRKAPRRHAAGLPVSSFTQTA